MKIERDLVKLVPREDWARFPHLMIWHGRRVCDRAPAALRGLRRQRPLPVEPCLRAIATGCSFDARRRGLRARAAAVRAGRVAWFAERLPLAARPRPRRRHRQAHASARRARRRRRRGRAGRRDARDAAARACPESRRSPGSAEAIPLPDESVDAVTVAQAFHWFRPSAALAEMHRVLRPGGGFALLWNDWDDDDPLMHALNDLVDALRRRESRWHEATSTSYDCVAALRDGRRRDVPPCRRARCRRRRRARARSVSAVSAAAPDVRDRTLAEVRAPRRSGHRRLPDERRRVVADRV